MKKTIFLAILLVLVFSMCSCSLLFPPDDAETPNKGGSDTSTVRIVYPTSEETIEIQPYTALNITPVIVDGMALLGYYAQPEATGIEYFNYRGEMNGTWRPEYPEMVYAVYEKFDYNKEYKTDLQLYEDPRSFYGAGFTCRLTDLPSDVALQSILYHNPDMDVKLTVHADIKQNGKYASATTMTFGMGAETFDAADFSSNASTYSHISLSHTVKAKQMTTSGVFVKFNWHDGSIGSYGLVKNVYYTVSLVEEQ